MRTIAKRMSLWRALFAVCTPFAIVAAVIAAVGAFAVEPAWAQGCTYCSKTHNGKTACIRVEGYESKWTSADNSADLSLWNSASGGDHARLIYKSIGNWASNRDKWHCQSLSSFTTQPSASSGTLDNTGKILVNNSRDSPKYFNLHQSHNRICMTMRRNNKGNSWIDPGNTDVWDIEQRNTSGSC